MTITCDLCHESFDRLWKFESHIRWTHPEDYSGCLQQWPDGGLVVIDDTLDPVDFKRGSS